MMGLSIGRTQQQFSAHDGDLHGVGARHLVDAITQLQGHAQSAPDGTAIVLADLADADPVLVGPCVPTIVRPAQHDLWVAALTEVQTSARLAVKLEAVMCGALQIVLTGG